MKNNIHVLFKDDNWYLKQENNDKIIKTFKTKEEAIDYGKNIAKKEKTELIIHNKNNIISNKNSYGSDSNPPIDKVL